MSSVPLSVTKFSGDPNLAIQFPSEEGDIGSFVSNEIL